MRVACQKCHGTYKNEKSCRSHWDKTHRAEHGTFLGDRVELVAPLPPLVVIKLARRVTSIRDPVDNFNIFTLTPASFVGVPVSHDGLLMTKKAYMAWTGASASMAHVYLTANLSPGPSTRILRRFPGVLGHPALATPFPELVAYLCTTPCENARIFREELILLIERLTSNEHNVADSARAVLASASPMCRQLLRLMHEKHTRQAASALHQALCSRVYFARSGPTDAVKIGVSHQVGARVKALQTGNDRDLNVEFVTEENALALDLEQALHRHLSSRHIRGEWYSLPRGTDFGAYVRECKKPTQ